MKFNLDDNRLDSEFDKVLTQAQFFIVNPKLCGDWIVNNKTQICAGFKSSKPIDPELEELYNCDVSIFMKINNLEPIERQHMYFYYTIINENLG